MSRIKVVIFEGVDKSGKSTLYQDFRRATNYQPLAIDRWFGSQIVYDRVWHRRDQSEKWYQEEERFQALYDVYLVVVSAPVDVLRDRIERKESGKDRSVALATFEMADALFQKYLDNSRFENKILIDTSRPRESCLEDILNFVGEKKVGNSGELE